MKMSSLETLYEKLFGVKPSATEAIPSSGSDRRYFRLSGDGRSVIGCAGTSPAENRAFISLSEHFRKASLNVPEVLCASRDGLSYLQEDLGNESLFEHRDDEELLCRAVSMLADFQFRGARNLDFSVCFPQREFDARMIYFDQNYFKYCFLKPSGIEFDEIALDDEFRKMKEILLGADKYGTFMYRDFQARNIMVRDGELWFIDFQGGRRGPFYYDAASFIWQARAAYCSGLREKLRRRYLESLRKYIEIDEEEFNATYRHFILFRTIQVLGAYGFRGLYERKPHFIESIPYAMRNIEELLEEPFVEYPYLTSVLKSLAAAYAVKNSAAADGLTVKVTSFSFKKGIPYDESGNGGGYVFDCRAIENPGKYDRYKKMSGLDAEVIEFLEKEGGITRFLERIYPMAEEHVEKYIKRGFSSLMFSFGCTGGQHRSVYSAQHLADHLKKKYPQINVVLKHREL